MWNSEVDLGHVEIVKNPANPISLIHAHSLSEYELIACTSLLTSNEQPTTVIRYILLVIRRIDRFWRIFTSGSFTLLGRLDTLQVLLARRKRREVFYPIRLPTGEVFVDGKSAAVDFQVIGQVFLDHVYGEMQLQDRVVIDVGAHKGYFAAYALMAGAKAIYSYEPEGTNFSCLARFAESARQHGKVIRVFQSAVSDKDGKLTLYLSRESWAHTIVPGQEQSPSEALRVDSCSLANILDKVKAEFFGQELILKIDAEGAECPLLLNTPAECFTSVKEVVFEYHRFGGCDLHMILERLRALGFVYVASVREADLHHFRAISGIRPELPPLVLSTFC